MLGPSQIAHLRPGVDRLHWLPRERVPKADAAVCGAAARSEESYNRIGEELKGLPKIVNMENER